MLTYQEVTESAEYLEKALKEPHEPGMPAKTRKYLARIVKTVGPERIEGYLEKTDQIYQAGTLLTKDGTRKRSLGGTFFHLVKQDFPELAQ